MFGKQVFNNVSDWDPTTVLGANEEFLILGIFIVQAIAYQQLKKVP